MAGAVQVAADQLAFKRGGRGSHVTAVSVPDGWADRDEIPKLPRDTYGEVAAQVWEAFWRSNIAARVDLGSEGYNLVRWLDAVDERERLLPVAQADPLVMGSTGNLVMNPLYRRIAECDRLIAQLSDHFGLTLLAKFRARIAFSEAAQSEDRLSRLLERRRDEVEAERIESASPVSGRVIEGKAREVEL